MKCPKCNGTDFVRLVFSYVWEHEHVDADTGKSRSEEVEREFQDTQEDWHCAGCDDYWPEYGEESGTEVLDKLTDMWYT